MALQVQDPPKDRSPHPHPKICTHITPIPLPADDCDRSHSMHAALSSLTAATASFDATMDSLSKTSAQHHQRVNDLERRMTNFRACLRRLDDVASSKAHHGELDDRVIMLYCPGSYETALQGMELELAKVREEMDSNNHPKEEKQPTSFGEMSTSNAARSAADAAVQKSLLRDVQMDNGQAVPSDAWLDHASMGLGVGRALEATNEQRSVPLLLGEDIRKGEMEYQRILDSLVLNASVTNEEGFDRLESFEESPGGSYRGGDDESVYSVTSQMSTMSVASSTRMTAGQRKRWHKQQMQSMKSRTKSSSTQMMHHPMLSTHNEASPQISAVAGRQQSLVGSHPYLCEVFHDSYGIGPEPPKGLVECSGFSARCTREGGTEFYPPSSHITDLLVFNTTRSSYGLAKSATLAVGMASGAKSAKETGEFARKAIIGHPVLPSSAARKSQLSGSGGNKPSLANLVFKADAHAEAKVALDLPASLPHGLSG